MMSANTSLFDVAIKACDKELVHSNCVSAMISSMTNVSGMLASPQPDYDAYFQAYCR